jgi:hypothetical protein
MPVKMTNWGMGFIGSDYTAPELRRLCLCGDLPNGKRVTTSAVVAKEGPRTYRTSSGSLYELSGDPDPAYVAYLQGIGRTLDLDDPIKGL